LFTSNIAGSYSGITSAHSTGTDRFAQHEKILHTNTPRGVPLESPLESPEIHFLVVLHTVATSNHSLNVRDADVGKVRAEKLLAVKEQASAVCTG
jgi:hypothetical protein